MDKQVRTLIHSATCYTDKERIGLALQQLLSLGLINGGIARLRTVRKPSGPKSKTRKPAPTLQKLTHRALKAHIPPIRRIRRLRRTFHPYGKLSLG